MVVHNNITAFINMLCLVRYVFSGAEVFMDDLSDLDEPVRKICTFRRETTLSFYAPIVVSPLFPLSDHNAGVYLSLSFTLF